MHRLHLGRDLVMFGIALALIVFSLLGSLGARLLLGTGATVRELRLQQANALLPVDVSSLTQRVDPLGSSLAGLARQDESDRSRTDLDRVEPDLRRITTTASAVEAARVNSLANAEPGTALRVHRTSLDIDGLLQRARLLAFSWREATDSLTSVFDRLASTPSILPTDGRVTSSFTRSRRHPILGRSRPHHGLDILASAGTPIIAAAKGVVTFAGYRGDYGLTIEIDHGYGTVTRYAHASRTLVRRDQTVERGDTIGRVGRTGLAAGPHLHYEVLLDGRPVDPRTYVLSADTVPQ